MKKPISLAIILSVITLSSCKFEQDVFRYDLHYEAGKGGILYGETTQTVKYGMAGTQVEAMSDEGWHFVDWSDGYKKPSRLDKNILSDFKLTANFAKNDPYCTINYVAIGGKIIGESTQRKLIGETTTSILAVSDYSYSYEFGWNDGRQSKRRSDLVTGDATYIINFTLKKSDVPLLVIETENKAPIVSKDEYLNAKYTLINDDPNSTFSDCSGRIKGRGNSTWKGLKKPYKMKLDDKIDVLGMGRAKTWNLLANYQDPSSIRNYMAHDLAKELNFEYDIDSRPIEIVLNDKYIGTYQITESVEINENRVLNKKEDETGNLDIPYLLEADARAYEEGVLGRDYFVINSEEIAYPFMIKSPDTSSPNFRVEQVQYIQAYFQEIADAFSSKDEARIDELIDVDSFIDHFLMEDLLGESDISFSSFFMYKDAGGKLFAGPMWDFDRSMGNCYIAPKVSWGLNAHLFYRLLFCTPGLVDRLSRRLEEVVKMIMPSLIKSSKIYDKYRISFDRNLLVWPEAIVPTVINYGADIYAASTQEEQISFTLGYMEERLAWFEANYKTIYGI